MPRAALVPCSWLGWWDGPWLLGPALTDLHGGHLTIIAASPPVPQISFLTVSFGSPCLPLIDDVGLLSFSSSCLSPSPVHFFSVEVICLLLLHEHYLT